MNQSKDQVVVDWNEFKALDESNRVQFALSLFEALQLQSAKEAFKMILATNPLNIEAIDHYTDILEQLDEFEEMERVIAATLIEQNEQIIRAYALSHKLFFKYAQQLNGEKSIQFYKIGITLLEAQIKATHQPTKQQLRDIGDAHAAIAEVYQSDLLTLKSSEQGCLLHIDLAFQQDPSNLDAQLQLANYHLNKEDDEKAKQDLRVIYERLMESDEENYEEDFKLQVSKLLVEVEDFNSAAQLLQRTLVQNEQNPETLYMLAFSKWKLGRFNEALQIAQQILNTPKIEMDEEIHTGTKELILELEKHDLTTEPQQVEDEEWMDIE